MTMRGKFPPRFGALLGGILCLATLLFACGRGGDADPGEGETVVGNGPRCILIGIDSASWDDLDPLLESGQLPNLERLRREGAWGTLKSFHPTASSILWTSIATGKVPEKHGIRSFVAPLPGGGLVPVSSNMRRVKAIWNLLSEAGIPVGVIGWWASWPAEEVRGFYCSDYTWPLKKDRQGFATGRDDGLDLSRRTYPAGILREVEPFLITQDTVSDQQRMALGLDRIPPTRGYAVADILCKDLSYMNAGQYLLDRYRPDFFAIYLEGIDAFKHLFWPVHRAYREWRYEGRSSLLPARGDRALAEVLEIHYRRIDAYIGELLERWGTMATLVVVSDHGYGDNPGRKPIPRTYDETITPDHWHNLDGIVLLHGQPIRSGLRMGDHSVLDITPTLLALLGRPVAADMDGEVITEAFRPEFLQAHPLESIPTYETGSPGPAVPEESPFDQEMLERLRSLGYLDP